MSFGRLNPKTIQELEDAFKFIPKNILESIKDYINSKKPRGNIQPKIGIRESEARAHIYTARNNGNIIIRGSTLSDFIHEFWHLIQGMNSDIRAIEHAFTYDRVRNEDGTIKPILDIPYSNDTEKKYGNSSFSNANVVDPYTVKQYNPDGSASNMRLHSASGATEVLTTGMGDLFGAEDIGRFTNPNGLVVVTGRGSKREYYKNPHMDIATGLWYTDETMTNLINPKKITGVFGLDIASPTDWDFKAFSIGMLLALADLESK